MNTMCKVNKKMCFRNVFKPFSKDTNRTHFLLENRTTESDIIGV